VLGLRLGLGFPRTNLEDGGGSARLLLAIREVLMAASERLMRSPCCRALYAGESKSSDGKSGVPGGVNSLHEKFQNHMGFSFLHFSS
jgi:hypothetical protein